MSKRLIRVLPHEIVQKQSFLQKHTLNAVLSNGNTVFGRLQSADGTQIVIKDTRDHLHQIALTDLYELVYDDAGDIVPKSRHRTI